MKNAEVAISSRRCRVTSLRTGRGGVKNLRTGEVTDLGEGLLLLEGPYPITCHGYFIIKRKLVINQKNCDR